MQFNDKQRPDASVRWSASLGGSEALRRCLRPAAAPFLRRAASAAAPLLRRAASFLLLAASLLLLAASFLLLAASFLLFEVEDKDQTLLFEGPLRFGDPKRFGGVFGRRRLSSCLLSCRLKMLRYNSVSLSVWIFLSFPQVTEMSCSWAGKH